MLSKRCFYLALIIAALTALAAASGLFLPGLYRDAATLVPVLQGQDIVTLVVAPLLGLAAYHARHGSTRSLLICIGLLGYIVYTYTGAAFAYSFNELILVYIALFSLSIFALIGVLTEIDAAEISASFDAEIPRKWIVLFLVTMALALGLGELSQIMSFYVTGQLPEAMQRIGATTYFVYTLDLGVIVPLSLIAAVWLWRNTHWGYVLAAAMLIKATTMGLALVSMSWFMVLAGLEGDSFLPLWVVIAVGGLGLSFWMLKHCDSQPNGTPTRFADVVRS